MLRIKTVISLTAICALLLLSFNGDNAYFIITANDVVLKVPEGFPRPRYNFKNNRLSPAVFMLGRKLFYDPILSKDSTTSCATCHQRIAAFAHFDHPLSHGINGLIGKRNVPALQNLIWNNAFMWDGGVNHLEVQPVNPITNPVEMDESIAQVIFKLRASPMYRKDFEQAFGDTMINSERMLKSLAQFTGLMISADSRYDRFIKGTDTFSLQEKKGLQLFRDKCADCHREPLFTDNSYRNNGLKPDTALRDKGRGAITGIEKDDYTFKVPGIRNVERTYPFMHDGRFRNLNDVLNFYGSPENFDEHAAVELRKIGRLSTDDKKNLLAFLLTLTDKTFLYDRRFVDPFMQ
jgi:cytochrome c peroxidase